ncbi:MAG TPA: peptidase [Thermoanaerobaculia bacterium]|nr:peptidase [Thermoanaerobaculia bacterium]
MRKLPVALLLLLALCLAVSCARMMPMEPTTLTAPSTPPPCPPGSAAPPAAASAAPPSNPLPATEKLAVLPDVPARLKQLPRTVVDYDRSLLDENEQQVVAKLIEASKLIDEIYWRQVSDDAVAYRDRLAKQAGGSALDRAGYDYFIANKGRWDRLAQDEPFIEPFGEAGAKPEGGAFYPADITKEELERYVAAHPDQKDAIEGLFTVVRRDGNRLTTVPYSQAYRQFLEPAAAKLREAASITNNVSLRDYLTKLADAFMKDNYRDSDIAWMDLNGPIEVVIGPYEVYEDEMFNYKASFESFVNVVDRPESEKLAAYAKHLPDMERNLPEPDEYKNPNRGTDSPIRVVQEIYTAGDARRGVQTSAFNLPNDEVVREMKGSKKVLLKNVMDAKFRQSGQPIANRVLDPSLRNLISFDAYFNHTLFHELSHGVGPGLIPDPKGGKERVDTRILLKNLYSSIEECKADVVGLWNILYAFDHKLLTSFNERQLYGTYTGLMFRSMRFGIDEAHGRGTAVQWNWLREKGAITPNGDGTYTFDAKKYREGIRSLATELLTIEAKGDYDRAKRLLDKYGVSTPEMQSVIAKLQDIPVDITPVFPAAGEK